MNRPPPPPAATHNPRTVSQTGLLLQCASAATFFTTDHGQVYASLQLGPAGHQPWPLRSALFQYWLLNRFYQEHETALGDPSRRAALRILEACAHCHSAPPHPVHQRVAGRGNPLQTIGLDLLNRHSEVVEITADAWNIVGDSDFSFHYHRGNLPLPRPLPAEPSALDLLPSLLNLAGPQDWLRCLPLLLAACRLLGPYPILVLQWPPGCGKSTAARMLRALIDPAIASLCPLPFSETALLTLAHNHWLLAFDHVAHASNRISSALCRLSTGHGFFYHERYHALEPVPLAVTLPSIPPQCRLDFVHLPAAPRFADTTTWAVAFGAHAHPVVEALCILMTDRVRWVGAASELLALPDPPDHPLWPCTPSAFSRQGHRDATTSKNAVTPSPRHRPPYPPPLYAHRQVLWGGRPRPQPDPPVGLGLPLNGPAAGKNLIPINIQDEMRRSYLDYAMSLIVGRAGPDVRDGLKPVHRRILFPSFQPRSAQQEVIERLLRADPGRRRPLLLRGRLLSAIPRVIVPVERCDHHGAVLPGHPSGLLHILLDGARQRHAPRIRHRLNTELHEFLRDHTSLRQPLRAESPPGGQPMEQTVGVRGRRLCLHRVIGCLERRRLLGIGALKNRALLAVSAQQPPNQPQRRAGTQVIFLGRSEKPVEIRRSQLFLISYAT